MSNSNTKTAVANATSNKETITNKSDVLLTQEVVRTLLQNNIYFQCKTLLKLYTVNQTQKERDIKGQIYQNFKGFDKNDARYLSEVAANLLKEDYTNKTKDIYRVPTIKDNAIKCELSRRLPKYWRQVIALIKENKFN